MIPARSIREVPPNFPETFIREGWRGVERQFQSRTDCLLKLIELAGGESLYEARRQFRATGVVAVPVTAVKPRTVVE